MADESVTEPASLIEIIRREAADNREGQGHEARRLLRTRQMIECAAAAGLRVVIGHGFGLTLSTLAEAAVAATSDAVMPGCEAVGPLKMAGDVVRDPINLEGGVIRLTDAPVLAPRSIRRAQALSRRAIGAMYSSILFERKAGIAVITLNRRAS